MSNLIKAIRVLLFGLFLFLPSLIVLMVTGFWADARQFFVPLGFIVLLINFGWLFTKHGSGTLSRGITGITGRRP